MAYFWSSGGWFPSMCLGESFDLGSSCTLRLLLDILNLFFLLNFLLALLISACKRNNNANDNRRRHWDSIIISILCIVVGAAYFSRTGWILCKESKYIHWDQVVVLSVRGVIWVVLSISVNVHPINWLEAIHLIWWSSFALLITVINVKDLVENHILPVLDIIQWFVNLLLLYDALKLIIKNKLHGRLVNESLSHALLEEEDNSSSYLSRAGFFSRLTFCWLNPLLRLGHSKTLELNDIPSLDNEDEAIHAYNTFSREWDLLRRSKKRTRNLVLFALAKCYKKEMILVGFYALLKSISIAISPLILYAFVWYSKLEHKDLNKGLALVGCLLIVKVVESLSQRHWFFDSRRCGMRMRSAVMAALYQKELKISSQGRLRHSTGEIVNYIAVDAYRLGDFPWWFHMAWSLPLQLLFSVAILFGTVGKGALPGIVPLVIFGFINIPVAKMLQHFQSQFMVAQDERLRATSEVLNNMKIIKLQSWEENFRNKIESLRGVEFKWLRKTQLTKSCGAALYWISPTVVSGVIFAGTAIMRSAPLNAGTIFTVLATLRVMSEPVRMLPEVLSVMIQVKVSLDRIDNFLQEDEIKEDNERRSSQQNLNLVAEVNNGVFSWVQSSIAPTLRNINLMIKKGQKIAVCGSVGSGKSSLLYALLGEIPKITGSVYLNGSIAYVSQTSWIQSGTLRDNILFGKPMNKKAYQKAIRCCAMDKDIENFDHGDLTEIGQRGLNMSGGQKQRIQLARAVYNDADIYLLDDPFSAVDAHTASILFHDCVMTALEKKTVILVTHQVEFLPQTDRILVMEGGKIIQTGRYEELLKSGTAFEQLVTAHQSSITSINSADNENRRTKAEDHLQVNRLQPIKQNSEGEISVTSISAVQLTEEEEMEIGNAGWKPYKDYINISKGTFILSLMITFQSIFIFLQGLSNYWLALVVQIDHKSDAMLVGVFSVISFISCIFLCVRSVLTAHLGLKASKEFFSSFMDSLFKAPMTFFDSTPLGRILTRASSDMSIVDFDIPYSISFVLIGAIEVVTTTVIIATVTWQVLVVAVPALIITIWVQNYYLASARELVRINGTTKAPVMNYAGESLLGVVTIRAFGTVERFFRTNLKLIDTDAKLFFHTVAAMEWVLMRVEALQSLTIITSTVFLVLLPQGTIAPGFSGLCLSYAFTLSSAQVFTTRWYSNIENYVISVERIKQFMHIPSEPPAIIYENRPSISWPHQGRIDLQDLKIKYRPTAPFVLKGITCTLKEGYKVGVVGRTGSGKTTLISALFRLVEPSSGTILIDNLNICSIGLKDLRMKLSIIPQEPTLFRGSIRSNLDPLGMHTDLEVWEALEKCQLKSIVSKLPALLDATVSDDGENWSIGQRQLFCLGRVILRKNKILVLDEATASIDSATDAILQKVIRKEFSSCTVITIAHRVPTVMDSDMVMVLSYGKIVEYDRPSKLMEMKDSDFAKLVAEYWLNCQGNTPSVNNL